MKDYFVEVLIKGVDFKLHPQWIRERCDCEECVHSTSLQPQVDLSHPKFSPESFKFDSYNVEEEYLTVKYEDGHVTRISVSNIVSEFKSFSEQGALQARSRDVSLPKRQSWTSNSFSMPVFDNTKLTNPQSKADLLHDLLVYGIVLINNVPQVAGELQRFAEQLVGYIRNTTWGPVFDVKVCTDGADRMGSTDQAFTGREIEFHVDNPYREPCIDYQLLHCIDSEGIPENEAINRFVDAIGCAEKLREEDYESFEYLTNISVKWEITKPHISLKPIIELDNERKHIQRVFISPKSGGFAPLLPPEELQNFYNAKRKFFKILEDETNIIRHQLKPGQLVMFVNSRILHSRTYFDASNVYRFLQGLYIDHDAVTHAYWNYKEEAKLETKSKDEPKWTQLIDCTKGDVCLMGREYTKDAEDNQINRILSLFLSQKGNHLKLGAPIDLYTHGLQTATRAYNAGESVDMIVGSLLHDVGELLTATNHGDISAGLLRPYIKPEITWILEHHEIFQMYYYGDQAGIDKNKRDLFKESPYYEITEKFCVLYDQTSFDPNFISKPLDFFMPMLKEVFSRKPFWHTPSHPKSSAVLVD